MQLVAEEFYDQDINTIIDEENLSTALTRATNRGSFKLIFKKKKNLHHKLHFCNFVGFGIIVNALLQWPGIDINVQERNGYTALHYAAQLGHEHFL